MALNEQARKPWKRPAVKSISVVAPLNLVCLSAQYQCADTSCVQDPCQCIPSEC